MEFKKIKIGHEPDLLVSKNRVARSYYSQLKIYIASKFNIFEENQFLEAKEAYEFIKPQSYSKLIFHPNFRKTLFELSDLKIALPSNPSDLEINFSLYGYPLNGKLVTEVEKFKKIKLDPIRGLKLYESGINICGYDESINKFLGLEGTAYLTSHCLIIHDDFDYVPINLLTFYFYTRSEALTSRSQYIKFSEDPELDSKKDYILDRKKFLVDNVPKNSILFIDGPLIGGQMSSNTIELNNLLLKKGIIPIFFVKNSNSNLVTDNIIELNKTYNSDMHWSYKFLKKGERTSLFRYVDQYNDNFAKIFCYIKGFNVSPQRIEIDINTFKKYSDVIINLFDLIYYLLLAQGNLKNPQIRTISIAEKYARNTLKLINLIETMKYLGITPTLNQERFM